MRDEMSVAGVQTRLYFSESRLAVPDTVAWARDSVVAFALAAGVRGQQLEDVRLVVSEAVTNAVMYAYSGTPGEVHVIAAVVSDELWIVVADDGKGLRAGSGEPRGLGLGLALMAQLSDGFTLAARSSGGVEARMQFLLAGTGADADAA